MSQGARATTPPTVDSVTITSTTLGGAMSTINLAENTTYNIFVHGEISDADTCSNLNSGSLAGTFYRAGVGSGCTADNNNCYRKSGGPSCLIYGCDVGDEVTVSFECAFTVQYYIDPTDAGTYQDEHWVGLISIDDNDANNATGQATTEVNSLVSLDISGSLNYGSIAHNATSSEQSITIRNTGNSQIDTNFIGSDLICGVGKIPGEHQRYSSSTGEDFANMIALSTTTQQTLQMNLEKQTSGTASEANVYFRLSGPTIGNPAGGSCAGTISAIAVAG